MFTFAEPFDDIFLFVKSSCTLVSGNANKSLRPKDRPTDQASEFAFLQNSRKKYNGHCEGLQNGNQSLIINQSLQSACVIILCTLNLQIFILTGFNLLFYSWDLMKSFTFYSSQNLNHFCSQDRIV